MKARLETGYGEWVERIPAWTKWATQVRVPSSQVMILAMFMGSSSASKCVCHRLF